MCLNVIETFILVSYSRVKVPRIVILRKTLPTARFRVARQGRLSLDRSEFLHSFGKVNKHQNLSIHCIPEMNNTRMHPGDRDLRQLGESLDRATQMARRGRVANPSSTAGGLPPRKQYLAARQRPSHRRTSLPKLNKILAQQERKSCDLGFADDVDNVTLATEASSTNQNNSWQSFESAEGQVLTQRLQQDLQRWSDLAPSQPQRPTRRVHHRSAAELDDQSRTSIESTPIDVDSLQEYHAPIKIEFDPYALTKQHQMSLVVQPHSVCSLPVSVDDSGPIDVDTGDELVLQEEDESSEEDLWVSGDFPILDETEMDRGLAGYMHGFEPPTLQTLFGGIDGVLEVDEGKFEI
jgi:hypothetical protein